MTSIIRPVLPGQMPIQIFRNLDGSTIIKIGDNAVGLNPRQACDMAVTILKSNGLQVEEFFDNVGDRLDDALGTPLMANLKVKLDGT